MFIHNDWAPILEREFEKPYMKELFSKLHEQYEIETVYPPKKSVFRAFELTPYSAVKVVILGQDPYHGENQANGLSFSVTETTKIPPSLRNIFTELVSDHILSCLNEKDAPIVFMLWGNHARSKKRLIDQRKHLVLESVHPSPLSAHRGFFGSAPFSKTNEFLVSKGIHPIDWTLTK